MGPHFTLFRLQRPCFLKAPFTGTGVSAGVTVPPSSAAESGLTPGPGAEPAASPVDSWSLTVSTHGLAGWMAWLALRFHSGVA